MVNMFIQNHMMNIRRLFLKPENTRISKKINTILMRDNDMKKKED